MFVSVVGACHGESSPKPSDSPSPLPELSSSPSPRMDSKSLGGSPSGGGSGKKPFRDRSFRDFEELRGYDEVVSIRVHPSTDDSRRSGKKLYQQACVFCHGKKGKPPRKNAALVRYNMADLSLPREYKYGSGPRAVYRSIAHGVPAPPMGPSEDIYTPQQIWDLVNYVRSLQKRR